MSYSVSTDMGAYIGGTHFFDDLAMAIASSDAWATAHPEVAVFIRDAASTIVYRSPLNPLPPLAPHVSVRKQILAELQKQTAILQKLVDGTCPLRS